MLDSNYSVDFVPPPPPLSLSVHPQRGGATVLDIVQQQAVLPSSPQRILNVEQQIPISLPGVERKRSDGGKEKKNLMPFSDQDKQFSLPTAVRFINE